MTDRLVGLLNSFGLHARTFQVGALCHSATFDDGDGLGYIHVLRHGTLGVTVADEIAHTLREPTLFFLMNPTRHQLSPLDDDVDMVCASFDFGAGLANPLLHALPDVLWLKINEIPSLSSTIYLLFSEAKEDNAGRQGVLDRLMEIIIIQLLRDLINENRIKIGLIAGLAEPRLAKALNAIHDKPADDWTLSSLASVAGMSRARFSAKFKEIVGMTPGHYLTQWRVGVAQSLIRAGKPLQVVADMVGYTNASALSRAFQTQIGLPPSVWRAQGSGSDVKK